MTFILIKIGTTIITCMYLYNYSGLFKIRLRYREFIAYTLLNLNKYCYLNYREEKMSIFKIVISVS